MIDEKDKIVSIEDGEDGGKIEKLGVEEKKIEEDGVECEKKGNELKRKEEKMEDKIINLERGIVGEGKGKNMDRIGKEGRKNM